VTASVAPIGIINLYRAYSDSGAAGTRARQLIDQQHWYASIAEFDPKTGDALPLAFDEVLHRLGRRTETKDLRDHLWRIVDHCRLSLENIFASLSENPRREQAYLPIRDVKELNAASFIALSRRPGRNVREKLAGKPYMQAVRRFQSVDLPQNRLVKEFVTRLAELLELRKRHLGHEDKLLGDIYRWLRTDEAYDIGRWDNLPPNNTLLSHRDYRRVWDGWRRLQELDDAIGRDFARLEGRVATIVRWEGFGAAYAAGETLFGDMPVLFDYDSFTIRSWHKPIKQQGSGPARPRRDRAAFEGPACVDLSYLRPRFAVGGQAAQVLPEAYLWQRWRKKGESVDLELFYADLALLSPDATTICITDLFFAKDEDEALVDWAAHAFARKLSKSFANPALIWLVPDFLNDFEVQATRRNLNARFAKAEPLPRSVAAVIEQVDYSKIRCSDFQVLVVDAVGGTTYATKLTAQHDEALEKRVPETRGFYWERSPHVTLKQAEASYDPLVEIPRIDRDGGHHGATPLPSMGLVNPKTLRNHLQIGSFDDVIAVKVSPVQGGLRLHELQQRAGDIPLWRDHIPELSIKVIKAGRYQPFFLVDRGTTIRPLRGVPVHIPLNNRFTLPAGRSHYQFPLFQGQDPDDLGYVARLESPAFPLASDATCFLTMTYTYGADDPYRLVFEPLDGSFAPVQVKWQPKTEEIITNAPAPGYPIPLTWAELQHHENASKVGFTNYLDWAVDQTSKCLETLEALSEPVVGTVKTDWKTNQSGRRFLFVRLDCGEDVYVGEFDLVRSMPRGKPAAGDEVHLLLVKKGPRILARHVALTEGAMIHDIAASMRRGLYVPYIKTWGDARSLSDADCPADFRRQFTALSPRLERAWNEESTPDHLRSELRFLLCCMHRDMPASVSRDLVEGASTEVLDERACAFALGDLSQEWQRRVFVAVWNRGDMQAVSIFAQAIWRTASFISVFDGASLAWLGATILSAMRETNELTRPRKSDVARLTQYCELILGLLRSRESLVTEVRMTLQPHQELTKNLADQVEAAVALVERSGVEVRSRVEIADLPDKPEGDSTPDLLFALRLYLTGDVGANAIRVTGVSDGEDN
jgi:hypothetical protein